MRVIPISLVFWFGVAASAQIANSQQAPPKPQVEQAKSAFALPHESITVTATRPTEETISSFVETRKTPTRIVNKMARWRRDICPLTVGLGDKYAKYVTRRIRDVASAVGAPVSGDPACKPNIEVVFTTLPQAFMDGVRKTGPAFLGYHDTSYQADELAKVTHPIQSWYTTESQDFDGSSQVDSGQCAGAGTTLNLFSIVPAQGSGWPRCANPRYAEPFLRTRDALERLAVGQWLRQRILQCSDPGRAGQAV